MGNTALESTPRTGQRVRLREEMKGRTADELRESVLRAEEVGDLSPL